MYNILSNFLFYLFLAYEAILGLAIFVSWFPNLRRTKFGSVLDRISGYYFDYFRETFTIGFINLGTIFALIIYNFLISCIWM